MPEGSGKALWEKVYNERVAAGDDKEKAAKKAWGALKNAGWKKNENGEWVKGKSEFAEFSMSIVKASFDKENQMMRWRSVNSDTDPDLYDEAMSPELFQDFVNRIENKTPVPSPFDELVCEDEWCGGMPYLSLAHYKSGTGKRNVPGEPDSVYVDGTMLKSTGFLYNNQLGKRVFDALNADLYKKKSDGSPEIPPERRVRISIGFLDLQHKHQLDDGTEQVFDRTDVGQICHLCSANIGRKIYTKGVLVHLALTRVPVNPRTLMEMEKSMGAIVTKKDDAASIIGEDLVDELEEKSLADGILVVKANGMTLDWPDSLDKCYDPNTASYDQDCIDNALAGHMPPLRNKMADNKKLKARTSDADSLTDRVDRIRSAFYYQFPSGQGIVSSSGGYVEDIFEDYVIVCAGQDKFRVPYTESEDGVEFGTIDKWNKVREETYYTDEKSDTVSKAQTKSESWGDEPASSYLIVGDREHPTSWHLPVKKHGKLDTGLMGAAKAALTSNHRGDPYGGPGKGKALAKLRSLYKSHGMEWDEGEKKSVTEDSMANVKGAMPSKKVTKPKNIDSFEDEERVVEDEGAYGQGKATTMRKGDEDETEAEDEQETAEDEKKEPKQKKSLMAKFSRVADKALELREAGISGKDAEAVLQPLLNEVGKEIEKSLSPTGDTALVSALAEITKTLAAQNELLLKNAQEIAVLKAGQGQAQPRVDSPFIPKPRSLRVEKSNPAQPTRKLSQIEEIARRSTGLPVE